MSADPGPAVLTERHDAILLLRLARPERRNAIDSEMEQALARELDAAEGDEGVRGVVLTGEGTAFSGGGDLSRFDAEQWDAPAFRRRSHGLSELIARVERIEKPVVMAVNGVATGAGTQLAMAGDLRLAARSARFLFREGHLGLIPSHGGCARLVKLVGLARAKDIVLGGRDLDADEAYRLGMVTAVVDDAALLDEAWRRLEEIFRRGAEAYGVAKRLLTLAASVDLTSGLAAETMAQSLLAGTAEHRDRLQQAQQRREGDRGRGAPS